MTEKSRDLGTEQEPGPPGVLDSIKLVPSDRKTRELIRREAFREAECLDRSQPLSRSRLEAIAQMILNRLELPRAYLGWTMVATGSAFWQPQVMGVPYERRLLLLPHCMRNATVCAAEYSQEGLRCLSCGGCSLGWLSDFARAKGYRVLIAEGTPVVMKMILGGEADALLGVACLNSLERSLEKILMVGIPCMAVPLLIDQCRDTATDEDWILEMVETPYVARAERGRSYLPLMRRVVQIIKEERDTLLPRRYVTGEKRGENTEDRLALTEHVAYEYLVEGGKFYRPFVTLGVYDALTGEQISRSALEDSRAIPRFVRRVALAVEIFHKASLIHDDIEDHDTHRYGRATLHERYGVPIALNVGDFLIGLGYSALASDDSSPELVADLLRIFARGHLDLCAGQGAELWLSRDPYQPVSVPEVLRIYALKTAPAFEVSILAGLRLAGPLPPWLSQVRKFTRSFGIAFQVQNDLADWQAQDENKMVSGNDFLTRRPTLLWALARHLMGNSFVELIREMETLELSAARRHLSTIRSVFQERGVFATAARILERERSRAIEATEAIPHEPVKTFLRYLAESALTSRYQV